MQTILGAGGAIGTPLAKELTAYTREIRLFGRHPKKVNEGDQLMTGDLTSAKDVDRAVAGSAIVYLVAGLQYDHRVWRQQWPMIMTNVLAACAQHGAKLVFFDNIYMIDRESLGHITETSPIRPCSKKGLVRAALVHLIEEAREAGTVDAMIVRAADFYGPGVGTSVLQEMVFKPFREGKKANLLFDPRFVHTYTFTPDAARATAQLGNTPEAYGEDWNLPTTHERLTGKDWIRLFADEMGVNPGYRVMPGFLVSLMGLFVPILREMKEMNYQFDRDYVFDSSKFEQQFGWGATDPREGVKAVVQAG